MTDNARQAFGYRATMKTLVTIFVVLALTGAANTAEMPKELRGSWCYTESSTSILVKCKKGDEDMVIGQGGLCIEDGCCEPLSVRKDKRSWVIKERCNMVADEKNRIVNSRYTRKGKYLYSE
jgi:hypothetical protein